MTHCRTRTRACSSALGFASIGATADATQPHCQHVARAKVFSIVDATQPHCLLARRVCHNFCPRNRRNNCIFLSRGRTGLCSSSRRGTHCVLHQYQSRLQRPHHCRSCHLHRYLGRCQSGIAAVRNSAQTTQAVASVQTPAPLSTQNHTRSHKSCSRPMWWWPLLLCTS